MSNHMSPLRIAGLLYSEYTRRAPLHGVVSDWPEDFRPTSPHGSLLLAVCAKVLKEVLGCQKCGGRRFHLIDTLGNDPNIRLGTLELCLDCGQVRGEWPYNVPEAGE